MFLLGKVWCPDGASVRFVGRRAHPRDVRGIQHTLPKTSSYEGQAGTQGPGPSRGKTGGVGSVSYTHLTLPTKRIV
eukprot:910485-Amorphochlora_amoeboformis.AAC.1